MLNSHASRANAMGGVAAHAVAREVGLVTSKTSRETTCINLAPSAVADRRIKRLKRSVWASGHLHGFADKGYRPPVCWFVTLTYVGVNDWRKEHMSKVIERFRTWCKDHGYPCRYTWVAELQNRGAVHYHLLAWLPHGVRMPQWDRPVSRRRSAFWPHGMTNTQIAKAGVGYLMKYLSKLGEFHRFPKGLRLYGIGGLTHDAKQIRAWFNLPEWVKRSHGVGDVLRSKGRLVVQETGEVLEAAFRVSRMPFGLVLQQLRELPPRFHDGCYSTLKAYQ